MLPHHDSIFYKFLHAIHQPISVPTWLHSASLIPFLALRELRISHGHTALIRNSKHAHPATQYTQRIHRIKRLRAPRYLRNGERTTLCGPHRARRQGNPVNLVLKHGSQIAVLFRADPNMAIAPLAEIAQFLDFGVGVLRVVFDGEAIRVVDADVAAKAEEDATGFEG